MAEGRFLSRDDVDLRLVPFELRSKVSNAWAFIDDETGFRCFPVASGGWFACASSIGGCVEGATWREAISRGKESEKLHAELQIRAAAQSPERFIPG